MSETEAKPAGERAGKRGEPTAKLAERVAAARLRAGLTQAELAEASGVADETISRIERGRYEPAVSTLFRLAEALDVSLDQLAGQGEQARNGERAGAGARGRGDAGRKPGKAPAASPLVRRLRARIAELTPEAQRALLAVAEQLPTLARPRAPR